MPPGAQQDGAGRILARDASVLQTAGLISSPFLRPRGGFSLARCAGSQRDARVRFFVARLKTRSFARRTVRPPQGQEQFCCPPYGNQQTRWRGKRRRLGGDLKSRPIRCAPRSRAAGCALNLAARAPGSSPLNTPQKPSNDAPPAERTKESPGAAARALVLVLVTIGCLGRGLADGAQILVCPQCEAVDWPCRMVRALAGSGFLEPTRPWRSSSSRW